MRRILIPSLAAALIGAPLQATPIDHSADQVRFGAFVGAQVSVPIGGGGAKRTTRAGLTVAPTHSRLSAAGYAQTRIGQGLALEFGRARPQLTLGGRPADVALGLTPAKSRVGDDPKMGLSTGATIGLGVLIIAAVAAAVYLSQDCNRLNENECSE